MLWEAMLLVLVVLAIAGTIESVWEGHRRSRRSPSRQWGRRR